MKQRRISMSRNMKVAFACYLLPALGLGAWGIMFVLRREFMPYHSAAVGMPWSAVPGTFQILLLGLIKLAGGAFFTLAAALVIILLIPFRQGHRWTLWAAPSLGIVCCLGLWNAMAFIALNSPGSPPWSITAVAVVLIGVGGFFSLRGNASSRGA